MDDVLECMYACTKRHCAAESEAVNRLTRRELGKLDAALKRKSITEKEHARRVTQLRGEVLASQEWRDFSAKFAASGCLAQVQKRLVRYVKAQTHAFVASVVLDSRRPEWGMPRLPRARRSF
jgi:hypothetical protein